MRYYIWQQGDDKYFVAAAKLAESGWPDTATFVSKIEMANAPAASTTAAGIYDWQAVPVGTRIILPYREGAIATN